MNLTLIPRQLRVGDSYQFQHGFMDWVNQGYTLTFAIRGISELTSITTTETFTLSSLQTSQLVVGNHTVIVYATLASERVTILSNVIEILPDLSVSGVTAEYSTHNQKMLAAMNAMLEARATNGQLDLIKASISTNGVVNKSYEKMDLNDLMKIRNYYQSLVNRETGRSIKKVLFNL